MCINIILIKSVKNMWATGLGLQNDISALHFSNARSPREKIRSVKPQNSDSRERRHFSS